ncbi:MAG: hypothetical protein ISS28_03490 [Candidatus Cloacimonetes bacterium]|nr:hypothetical protein [Candidatus Cloacimonadota bacterium]MBL7086155.1 hypothetical protein [Candidatus Cloacimonadota bacterium]
MVALVFIIAFATHLAAYDPNIDWDYPHEECTNGDWRSEWYVVYYDGNMGVEPIHSPFYWTNQPNLTPISNEDDSDFQPEDGWNLLAVDFGDPYGIAVECPYLALYNKYLGIIRAFIFIPDPIANYTATIFAVVYGGDSSLLAHASENMYLRAADKRDEETDNNYGLVNPEQGGMG